MRYCNTCAKAHDLPIEIGITLETPRYCEICQELKPDVIDVHWVMLRAHDRREQQKALDKVTELVNSKSSIHGSF